MGPLALADLVGLDICLSIMDVLYEEFREPKYRACTLLRKWSEPENWDRRPEKDSININKF